MPDTRTDVLKHPQNLHNNHANTWVLDILLNCILFIRLATFLSSVFATWAPDLFHYYAMYLCDLLMHDISLVMNWTSCIFAAATFNFANLPFGWCAITTLGRFDPRFGGHLVLWDLKLVLDFPPGSTILIPSAILRHSNTTIGRSERRYSFMQYTMGGLFRWVDCGFQTSEEYWASLDADGLAKA
ncbi:hypothetical protein ARMSODRAFT_990951 [Armillaria solidipes]|uniref:Uncharacterized protein n=1 Tax=Armillaria solidipes TaxID=1076256 RepID=A0A2H3AZY9_9AGAR|nr:hypothetical protein ARMSODRAFT_990951 [Armillaria solidipes]